MYFKKNNPVNYRKKSLRGREAGGIAVTYGRL